MQAHEVADLVEQELESYDSVGYFDVEFGHLQNGNEYVDIVIEEVPYDVLDEVEMKIPNDWRRKMEENMTLRLERTSKPNF